MDDVTTDDINQSSLSKDTEAPMFPESIKEELYSRSSTFFGDESWRRLQSKFVIVVGAGGVGSHAAHMLTRSGVMKIRIIDFDQVSLSSLNRHAVSTLEDVGTPKVATMQKRLKAIVPWCDIETSNEMFRFAQNSIALQHLTIIFLLL